MYDYLRQKYLTCALSRIKIYYTLGDIFISSQKKYLLSTASEKAEGNWGRQGRRDVLQCQASRLLIIDVIAILNNVLLRYYLFSEYSSDFKSHISGYKDLINIASYTNGKTLRH